MRRIGRIVGAAMLFAALAGTAAAQGLPAPALVDRFSYGDWSIGLPPGWSTDVTGFPILASNALGIGAMLQNNALPAGTIAIGVIPPDGYGLFGLGTMTDPREAVAAVGAIYGGTTAAEEFPIENQIAFWSPLVLPRAGHNLTIVSVAVDESLFTLLVEVDDFELAVPLIQAMIASIEVAP